MSVEITEKRTKDRMNAASGQTARPTDLTCQPLPLLSHFLRNFFETIQIYLSFHQSPRSLSCWGLPSFLWLGDPFKFVGIDFDSFLQSAKWAVVLRCLVGGADVKISNRKKSCTLCFLHILLLQTWSQTFIPTVVGVLYMCHVCHLLHGTW